MNFFLPMWRRMVFGLALTATSTFNLRAGPPLVPVTAREMYSVAQLGDAQRVAAAQGKPVGFLLTWPMYFPGAQNFMAGGSQSTTHFYRAFKDLAVLVNVDHATGELERLPKVALDAFHSPAEGGYAPCLCLTDATFTRLIGIIPLWKDPAEREQLFRQFRALIADKNRWGQAVSLVAVVEAAAPGASPATPPTVAAPRPVPATPPAAASGSFQREMELTLQAERQRQKASPAPKP